MRQKGFKQTFQNISIEYFLKVFCFPVKANIPLHIKRKNCTQNNFFKIVSKLKHKLLINSLHEYLYLYASLYSIYRLLTDLLFIFQKNIYVTFYNESSSKTCMNLKINLLMYLLFKITFQWCTFIKHSVNMKSKEVVSKVSL